MQTVQLTWEQSFELAAALTVVGGAAALSGRKIVRQGGAFLREAAVIGVLYGMWSLAGYLSLGGTSGGVARAERIRHWERWLPLPSEHAMQQPFLHHRLILQIFSLYYDTMHFTMMFVFLIWLFVRHRDRYKPIRQVMAWTTLGCLLVQLIPVAPPRMLPGIVDVAAKVGLSVYSGGLAVDQLSAMPSVHVAWAVLVGFYVWRVSPSRWRFIGPLHSVITITVVVVTGNHWWSDGIVAVAILSVAAWSVYGVRRGWAAFVTPRLPQWRPGRLLPSTGAGGAVTAGSRELSPAGSAPPPE